jgi:dipeptidase E
MIDRRTWSMHIIAMSSGLLQKTPASALLQDYITDLVARPRPRVALLPTATGDSADTIVDFYATFDADRYEPSHLTLFARTVDDLRSFVLRQQVIYVPGGNTANLLAIWRTHGLDRILREAWQKDIVLCGSSAGGLCWFEAGITDSFGPTLAALTSGLGFLPGSFCPHYDSEPARQPTYHRCVGDGLANGWACEDGTVLHFQGTELSEAVSALPTARAYRVERDDSGVRETPLPLRLLL